MKKETDIQIIITCKREAVTPSFAKVTLSIKNGSRNNLKLQNLSWKSNYKQNTIRRKRSREMKHPMFTLRNTVDKIFFSKEHVNKQLGLKPLKH